METINDGLKPAKGIIIGMVLGTLIWVIIGVSLYLIMGG
jgi:uncharacterized membrane protein